MKGTLDNFIINQKEDIVVDMNNPTCVGCIDCCGMFSFISEQEYKELKRYLTKTKTGRVKYALGLARVLNGMQKHDAMYLICPFATENKRCDIYNRRPSVCRDFHCTSELNKVADKMKYGPFSIFLLFHEDLMKNSNFANGLSQIYTNLKMR